MAVRMPGGSGPVSRSRARLHRGTRDRARRARLLFPGREAACRSRKDALNSALYPPDAEEVPPEQPGFSFGTPVGSVMAVPVDGTHLGRMAVRAGTVADHDLRVVRVALREHRSVADRQLRF